jgi:redox-sensing transcriptional repressor
MSTKHVGKQVWAWQEQVLSDTGKSSSAHEMQTAQPQKTSPLSPGGQRDGVEGDSSSFDRQSTAPGSMNTKSKKAISRLSKYKNSLNRFKSLGFKKIFSDYLAEAVGVTSSQVRKDFSMFGITGNKRGGYTIDDLLEKLNFILGKDEIQRVIIVGAGRLGSALLTYKNFFNNGIIITACFDIDPTKLNPHKEIPALPLTELKRFVQQNAIKIGIICVPDIVAQDVLNLMVDSGIKGVLNFAPIQLRTEKECYINNVNLEMELENIIYFVNAQERH